MIIGVPTEAESVEHRVAVDTGDGEEALSQALSNVLHNATKFTPQGGTIAWRGELCALAASCERQDASIQLLALSGWGRSSSLRTGCLPSPHARSVERPTARAAARRRRSDTRRRNAA